GTNTEESGNQEVCCEIVSLRNNRKAASTKYQLYGWLTKLEQRQFQQTWHVGMCLLLPHTQNLCGKISSSRLA
ncbi:mCG1026230, partial [Mus musculus]